jgi:hypothetical protein
VLCVDLRKTAIISLFLINLSVLITEAVGTQHGTEWVFKPNRCIFVLKVLIKYRTCIGHFRGRNYSDMFLGQTVCMEFSRMVGRR